MFFVMNRDFTACLWDLCEVIMSLLEAGGHCRLSVQRNNFDCRDVKSRTQTTTQSHSETKINLACVCLVFKGTWLFRKRFTTIEKMWSTAVWPMCWHQISLFCVASNSQNIEFGARKPPSSDEETLPFLILRHFNQSVDIFLKILYISFIIQVSIESIDWY